MAIGGRPAGVSEDWPIVQACNTIAVLTDEERDVVSNIARGEHPPQDQYRCELAAGHHGQHHALTQIADRQETWLAWENDGPHTLRNYNGCPLEIPLARTYRDKTTACNLFDGHVGPHPCGGDLWWWGD